MPPVPKEIIDNEDVFIDPNVRKVNVDDSPDLLTLQLCLIRIVEFYQVP